MDKCSRKHIAWLTSLDLNRKNICDTITAIGYFMENGIHTFKRLHEDNPDDVKKLEILLKNKYDKDTIRLKDKGDGDYVFWINPNASKQ